MTMKYVMTLVFSLWMTSCTAQDALYYQTHPAALQRALEACPTHVPKEMSCAQLEKIANEMNELVYQLRSNPQGYGQSILHLQESIARQELALKQNKEQAELSQSLQQDKLRLKSRLAIVGWLESPES